MTIWFYYNSPPPPRQPSGRVLASSGSIPSQGPRHTKDVIKMVPGSSLVWHSTLKREILALSQQLR